MDMEGLEVYTTEHQRDRTGALIDSANGINVDDCEKVNNEINEIKEDIENDELVTTIALNTIKDSIGLDKQFKLPNDVSTYNNLIDIIAA